MQIARRTRGGVAGGEIQNTGRWTRSRARPALAGVSPRCVPKSRSATLGVWRWTKSRVYQRARPVRRPQESASSRSISAGILSLLISALISARWHVLFAGGAARAHVRGHRPEGYGHTVTRYRTLCVRDAGAGRRRRSRETGACMEHATCKIIKKARIPLPRVARPIFAVEFRPFSPSAFTDHGL